MIAVVIPCFNEALRFNVSLWQDTISKFDNYYWVFVNDGSTDATSFVLNTLQGENLRIIEYDSNLGKGEAIRFGLSYILEELPKTDLLLIGFLDADYAFSQNDVKYLLNESLEKIHLVGEFDVVIGSRVKLAGRDIIRDNFRHYFGRIITTFICLGWMSAPYDTQSGFKIFRLNGNFKDAIKNPFETNWFFDVELFLRLENLQPLRICEIPVMSWHETKGSNIRIKNFYSILVEILRVRSLVRQHLRTRKI
jgi:glycosyltransferase involved in cell wall biosynthesis